mmetsp:Transcript_15488/g.37485  ORF Transcript_15488/g.37485 Transcript_15488/m.37485 type:complete len:81 (-) Transcript_15488:101-343(-)
MLAVLIKTGKKTSQSLPDFLSTLFLHLSELLTVPRKQNEIATELKRVEGEIDKMAYAQLEKTHKEQLARLGEKLLRKRAQ